MSINLDVEIFAEKIFYFKEILPEPHKAIHMFESMDEILKETDCFDPLVSWDAMGPLNDRPTVYGIKRQSWKKKVETTQEPIKSFYENLNKIFYTAGEYYFNSLGIEFKEEFMKDLAFFKYNEGASMGPHVDDDDDYWVSQGLRRTQDPIATGLIYLNNDKVGGELYFKEQDVLINPIPGSMVIFPCKKPFYHQSTKVESGNKYSVGLGYHRQVYEL